MRKNELRELKELIMDEVDYLESVVHRTGRRQGIRELAGKLSEKEKQALVNDIDSMNYFRGLSDGSGLIQEMRIRCVLRKFGMMPSRRRVQ
jgi:hypothetical protein